MNIDISLNQGKKFNQYQNKIKKSVDMQDLFTPLPNSAKRTKTSMKTNRKSVEPFQNIFKTTARNMQIAEKQNASDSLETQDLVNQFNLLSGEYDTLAKEASVSTKEILARNSDRNPYRGKNISLADNQAFGYVTDLGTYKWWANIGEDPQGKNGCPAWTGYETVNVKNSSVFNTPGGIIDTKPTLVVGTQMVAGQSCGNEGKNVYVNKQVNNPTATYLGCYKDVADTQAGGGERAMIWDPSVIGYTTLDTCKKFASDNGYGYFGMQDGQADGTAACLLGGDLATIQKYGTPPVYTGIPIWSSGTNDSSVGPVPAPTGQVTFYQDCSFSGTSASFGIGTYASSNFDNLPTGTIVDSTISNDNISSVKVPDGLQVVLWAGYVGDGAGSLTLGPGEYSCLIDYGFNDVVSTWVVSADPNAKPPVNTGNYVVMVNSRLQICTSDGTVIMSLPEAEDPDCIGGGALNMSDGFSATYGGNCSAQGYDVANNNVKDIVQYLYNTNLYTSYKGPSPASFPLSINNADLGIDPAKGCGKGFDTAYKCGNTMMTGHMDFAENQYYGYDCSAIMDACQYTFVLQDDANMCIYKNGSDAAFWSSGTNGKGFNVSCPWWVASEGKYKTNSLVNGQILGPGEWIGSTSGTLMLQMQTDGNLVLYAAQLLPQCYENSKGEMVGPGWINAVYKIDDAGNPASVGKVGYIDGDTNLHEYPSDMLGKSNNYTVLKNTDSYGYDIWNYSNATVDSCKTSCNNNDDCAGFAFDNNNQICYLKNSEMYPKGEKQYVPGLDIYVRDPTVCKTSKYTKYLNTDSGGNDLGAINNSTVDQCETHCDNTSDCTGFAFDHANNCYPKNSNMPTSATQSSGYVDLYVRNTGDNVKQCANIDTTVDSIRYDAYVKGSNMAEGVNFNPVIPDIRIQDRLSDLEQQLSDLGNQISDKLNSTYTEATNLNDGMTKKETLLSNDLKSYYSIKHQIDSLLSQDDPNYNNTKQRSTNNKRSTKNNNLSTNNMQTVETMLNMHDLDAMVSDSDLIVIQQNSQYILWTLLALGILVITVNTLKK